MGGSHGDSWMATTLDSSSTFIHWLSLRMDGASDSYSLGSLTVGAILGLIPIARTVFGMSPED